MNKSVERLLIDASKLGEELLEKEVLTEKEKRFLKSLDKVIEQWEAVNM